MFGLAGKKMDYKPIKHNFNQIIQVLNSSTPYNLKNPKPNITIVYWLSNIKRTSRYRFNNQIHNILYKSYIQTTHIKSLSSNRTKQNSLYNIIT
ncbi:hypothetical protein Hanom_Chr02g00102061 [Helianthus anomalus]